MTAAVTTARATWQAAHHAEMELREKVQLLGYGIAKVAAHGPVDRESLDMFVAMDAEWQAARDVCAEAWVALVDARHAALAEVEQRRGVAA